MKRLIKIYGLFFLLMFTLTSFGQKINTLKILDEFTLGCNTYTEIVEQYNLNTFEVASFDTLNIEIKIVTAKFVDIPNLKGRFELTFMDDLLFATEYYPSSDSKVKNYLKYLKKNFTEIEKNKWENKYMIVEYTNNGLYDSFYHYHRFLSYVFVPRYIIKTK